MPYLQAKDVGEWFAGDWDAEDVRHGYSGDALEVGDKQRKYQTIPKTNDTIPKQYKFAINHTSNTTEGSPYCNIAFDLIFNPIIKFI